MSNPITELSGQHIGERITVEDEHAGITATGVLFEVSHEADMISRFIFGEASSYDVGRKKTSINLSGLGTLTIGSRATFTVHDGKS